MKRFFVALLSVFILTGALAVLGQRIKRNRILRYFDKRTLISDQIERTYYVFAPKTLHRRKKIPLVFVFHGGGGTAAYTERVTKFSRLARRDKFIVVYPEAMYKNWNDGRGSKHVRSHRENINDLGFVEEMIYSLTKEYNIDEKRIYATGISNGAFFSNYVGGNLSEKFAAIAPVVGGIAEPFSKKFNPDNPVSVFIIQGTADGLVPYNGGIVAKRRGRTISTDDAINLWTKNNKTDNRSINRRLPNIDKKDGCTVNSFLWKNGTAGTEVKLFKMNGGGHTWAGTKNYLPKIIVGNICMDFDASVEIWNFFKSHPKK